MLKQKFKITCCHYEKVVHHSHLFNKSLSSELKVPFKGIFAKNLLTICEDLLFAHFLLLKFIVCSSLLVQIESKVAELFMFTQ